MTSPLATSTAPARPVPPPDRAARIVTVGAVVWLSSELMFFGGLFGAYLTLRGAAELHDVRAVIVGFDDRGYRAAFA